MDKLRTINEHIVIRDTVGYDAIKDIEVHDLPGIIDFLKIIWNYQKLNAFYRILN